MIRRFADSLVSLINTDEICARFGGDEFCIVILNNEQYRKEIFESEFADVLRGLNSSLDKPYAIHASIGICDFKDAPSSDIFTCFKIADERMYTNKRAYKQSLKKE